MSLVLACMLALLPKSLFKSQGLYSELMLVKLQGLIVDMYIRVIFVNGASTELLEF